MRSDYLKLNARDFFRGLIVAVGTAALGVIYGAVQTDFTLTWEYWQPVTVDAIKAAVSGFITYLAMNLFSGNVTEK